MYFFIPDSPRYDDSLFYKQSFSCYCNIEQYLMQTISGYIEIYKCNYYDLDDFESETYNVYLKGERVGIIYESENWKNFVNDCLRLSKMIKNTHLVFPNCSSDGYCYMLDVINKWKNASGV